MLAFIKYHAVTLVGIVYLVGCTAYDIALDSIWLAALMAMFTGACLTTLLSNEASRRRLAAARIERDRAVAEANAYIASVRAEFNLPPKETP